jgi:formylglycine-generating enzyme required for sulfatase activity
VSGVSWTDAVEFCNWLSLREGLPVAYERREGRWQLVQPRNHGYRLPTEADEAARRIDAGAKTTCLGRINRRHRRGRQPWRPGIAAVDRARACWQRLPEYRDEHAVVALCQKARAPRRACTTWAAMLRGRTVYTAARVRASDRSEAPHDGPHVVRGANWRTASIAELRLAWRDRAAGASQTLGFRVARSVESTP